MNLIQWKRVIFMVLFCCIVLGVYVYFEKSGITNVESSDKNYSIQKGSSVTIVEESRKTNMTMDFSNKNKPIQKGDSVTILVEWNTQEISNIIFENLYTPTEKEVKNGKYTLVVKPEKIITYQITKVPTRGRKPTTFPYKIAVLDENGVQLEDTTSREIVI
ncbi:hypothetical protein [Butyricimonas synergistica]|uniref:hypothetical protein n=1 Tax=Butyricimonas synergistica TaxID=544644 RepID=UPI0012DE4FCF|nr:hypothetical protein [Butyricimonas synergistica]